MGWLEKLCVTVVFDRPGKRRGSYAAPRDHKKGPGYPSPRDVGGEAAGLGCRRIEKPISSGRRACDDGTSALLQESRCPRREIRGSTDDSFLFDLLRGREHSNAARKWNLGAGKTRGSRV